MSARSARRSLSAIPELALTVSLLSGCAKDFAGPYPCNANFESCTTADQCETNVTTDPEHCGACGTACPEGAICTDKQCSAAPLQLVDGVNVSTLAMNRENLYWSSETAISGGGGGVEGLRKSDATAFTIAMPGAGPSNNMPFAVDDSEIFYFQFTNGANGPEARLTAVPATTGTSSSARDVGTLQTQNLNAQMLAVSGDAVFSSFNSNGGGQNNPLSVFSAPKAGGTVTPVATFTYWNGGFVVDSTNVYAIGPCELDWAPASGGKVSKLASAPELGCPSVLASDGTTVFWAASVTKYSNDSNNGNSAPRCVFSVAGVSVGGGRAATLASSQMDEAPIRMAMDDSDVYVATQKSVWRVAKTGGALARVAGNLGVAPNNQGPNDPGSGCTSNGNFNGGSYPVALAVDDSNVFIAVAKSGQPSALFKIPK